MKKSRRMLCAAVAVALTLGVSSAALSGCVATNNENDVRQVIATVNLADDEAFKAEFGQYANAVTEERILKRDLILSYINVGSSLSNSYSSAGDTFKALADSLVANAVVTQYATAALLKAKVSEDKLGEFNALTTEEEKYEYILGGKNSDGVKRATYNLYKLLNGTLDSYEKGYIEEEKGYTGSGTRSTPSGVDKEEDDFYPKKENGSLDYNVYTGYKVSEDKNYLLENCGQYEKLDGTSRNTRRKAYASLISYLKSNYLLSSEDSDTTDLLNLTYVKQTYISYLRTEIIDEYGKDFEEKQKLAVDSVIDGEYAYVKEQYENSKDGELVKQKNLYSDSSVFEGAMGNISDTSFILYSPEITGEGKYGYVYNILLPFSSTQSIALKDLDSRHDKGNMDDTQYYAARNELLREIKTTDQRAAWFNGTTDYAFDATEKLSSWYGKDSGRNYLFFENNLTDSYRYKPLEKYYGEYSYNGVVSKNKNGSYKLIPKQIDIDGMLNEFSAYIEYVIGDGRVSWNYGDIIDPSKTDSQAAYYDYANSDFYKSGSKKEIDYSKFVYATGRVDILQDGREIKSDDMFVKDNVRYKAMSAVNELQYAYTTDTGVLSQYIGYSVSAYDTNYIKEFEYAAHEAVKEGAGTFKVCAGSYGWHLIYVTETYTFNENGVYTPDWSVAGDRINKEGTFEYRFYNWIKDFDLSSEVNRKQSAILNAYNSETTVTKYTNAYKDLTELS